MHSNSTRSIFVPATTLAAAQKYLADGMAPVPIPLREKSPRVPGWPSLRLTAAELPLHFAGRTNIGILNGNPSGGLVDIDLDCSQALVVASALLPSTLKFGRASCPESHFLYRCPGGNTKRYCDPVDKSCLMEVRSDGSQTVFPPSVHPSGEEVQFANAELITELAANLLESLADLAAAATILARHWPTKGSRQDAAMALAGGLLRGGMPGATAERLIRATALAAGDEESERRVDVVAATKSKADADEPTTGFQRLVELMDPRVVKKAREWLRLAGPGDDTSEARTGSQDVFEKLRAAGRFYRDGEVLLYVPTKGGDPIKVGTRRFESVVAAHLGRGRGKNLRAVVGALTYDAMAVAEPAKLSYLSARGPNGEVLVSIGDGVVLRCESDRHSTTVNGAAGLLFGHDPGFLSLKASALESSGAHPSMPFAFLRKTILDCLPPPSGLLTAEEQQALVLAGWLGTFIQPWAMGRPILLMLGPPGSGKSVTQRLLAKAFFGPSGDTAGGTSLERAMKDLAAAVVHHSLVVRDDFNELAQGASDVLNRIATGTTFQMAAFHETLKEETYLGRAQVILSAFRPTWLQRADLMSRLLVIEFAKSPTTSMTERQRVEEVLAARNAIWAETLFALRLLALPLPDRSAIGRFDDFEKVVAPMMAYAGFGNAFDSALRKMPAVTVHLAAQADAMLGVVLRLAHNPEVSGKWWTAAALADLVAKAMGVSAVKHQPHRAGGLTHNPQQLAKFLGRLEREAGAVILVESRDGHDHMKVWRITPRALDLEPPSEPCLMGEVDEPAPLLEVVDDAAGDDAEHLDRQVQAPELE